jgi:uncharacterized membrane protein
MRKVRTPLWVAMLLTGSGVAVAGGSEGVSFAQVNDILARQCVMCHQPYDAKGELTLHPAGAYENLVGVTSRQANMLLVSPGDAEQSYLYRKLTNTHVDAGGSGDAMPFDAQLTQAQLDTIRAWIEQGAKDD